jgi:hypothetical protein
MKREIWKKGYCGIFAAVVCMALLGCNNLITPPVEAYPPGQGKIALSITTVSTVARSIIPEMSLPLVRVELIPAADSGIEPIVTEFEGDTGGEIALPPGVWTVKLYGYIDAGQPPVATGTAGNVEVFSGKTAHLTVTITPEPITTEFTGTGYLRLEIKTTLTDVNTVTVTANKDGKAYAINAPSTTALEPGYYFVTTQVTRSSGAIVAYEKIVWIYPAYTAYWIITVNAEDFYLKDGNLKLNIVFDPHDPPARGARR